jgi:hypothetical protein
MLEQLRSGIMSAEWVANVADVDQLRAALTAAESEVAALRAERDRLRELVREVVGSGVEYRIGYLVVQIDRPTWDALRAALGDG